MRFQPLVRCVVTLSFCNVFKLALATTLGAILDTIIEGFLSQFSEEHELDPTLESDQAFEVFAGYCVLHEFHDDPYP